MSGHSAKRYSVFINIRKAGQCHYCVENERRADKLVTATAEISDKKVTECEK